MKTGKAFINEDLIVDEPGERHTICFFNTKSYWPMAYNPAKNFLYVPFIDNCLDMTSANPQLQLRRHRCGSASSAGCARRGTWSRRAAAARRPRWRRSPARNRAARRRIRIR